MPTIFESLEAALQGNDLDKTLTAQIGGLANVGDLLSHPPQSVQAFGPALRALSLPNLDAPGGFSSGLAALKSAVPADLSSFTAPLTSGLDKIKPADIAGALGEALSAINALYQLTQLDFRGTGSPPAAPRGLALRDTPPPPPAAAQSMDEVSGLLDKLPSPLNVDSLLSFVQHALAEIDNLGMRQLPIVGELRDVLDTLLRWKGADAGAIRAEVLGTLQALDEFLKNPLDPALSPAFTEAADIASHIPATGLAQIADNVAARLAEIRTAVTAGDLGPASGALTSLKQSLDQYDPLRAAFPAGRFPGFLNTLAGLPEDADDQMGRVVSSLRPSRSLGLLDSLAAQTQGPSLQQLLDPVRHLLGQLVSWLKDLLDKVDIAAVTKPLQTAADAARTAVDALDNGVVAVTTQVQSLLAQVDSLLAAIDPAAAAGQVKSAIEAFKTQLTGQVNNLLKPVHDAIAKVVDDIDKGVSAFDPDHIKDVLDDAIGKIAGVLKDPRIVEVRQALDQAASQLESFSFAPFTDVVVKDIEKITETLQALGDTPAGPAIGGALDAALSVLPESLTPITDPLLDEFSKILAEGPIPALQTVEQFPQQLVDKVRSFHPSDLIGEGLSKSYQDLLGKMETFTPSSLLEPVKNELNTLKDRLKENVNPGDAIGALEGPFHEMVQAFDQFRPDDLIKPIDDAIQAAIASLTNAVPIDDVFAQVDAALQRVKSVFDTAARAAAMVGKVRDLLGGLANPQAQLDAFLAPILAKFDAIGDTAPLEAVLGSVSASVDKLHAAALTAALHTGLDPLVSTLDTLDPQRRLTALIQATRAISASAVNSLPASAEKTALQEALARLDFSKPDFAGPYQSLATLRQQVSQAESAFAAALADWDARYLAEGGALASLRDLHPTPAHLRQWVHDAAESELKGPLAAVLSLADPARQILDAVATPVQALMTEIETKLADLLLGPSSLQAIADALKQVIDKLKNFNLGFLRDSLNGLFAQVREKLDAINPEQVRKAIEAAFNDMLDTLSIDLFLPPDDIKKLDDDYAKLLEKLKGLDPDKLVTGIVQDVFEKDVVPLLDTFDLAKPLQSIVERVQKLADELKTELERVDQAFQAMRQAIPSGEASATAGVSV